MFDNDLIMFYIPKWWVNKCLCLSLHNVFYNLFMHETPYNNVLLWLYIYVYTYKPQKINILTILGVQFSGTKCIYVVSQPSPTIHFQDLKKKLIMVFFFRAV